MLFRSNAAFSVPFEVLNIEQDAVRETITESYLTQCNAAMQEYKKMAVAVGNDAAGYVAPHSLRNVLLISATPFEWAHILSQRCCKRNSLETRYVFTLIWKMFHDIDPTLFGTSTTGPFCLHGTCP